MNEYVPVGIVAGSGIALGHLLDDSHEEIPFTDIPGIPAAQVSGHAGKFLIGTCQGIPLVIQSGRLHFYEGFTFDEICSTVNFMRDRGVQSIVLTNAAGGLESAMKPGDLMAVSSIAVWPYTHWPEAPEHISMDFMLEGCDFEGVYTWVHGPCYETRSEIHALQATRSQAVGMSTAPEVLRCEELGVRTASISCITNNCCEPVKLTHEHVLSTARLASDRIAEIIRGSLRSMSERKSGMRQ